MSDVTLKDLSVGLREEAAEIHRIAAAALDAMSSIDGKHEDEKSGGEFPPYTNDVFGDLLFAKNDLRQAAFRLIDLSERIRRANTASVKQASTEYPLETVLGACPGGMRIR